MNRRWKSFFVHLLTGAVVVGSLLGLISWRWYCPPGWQLRGVGVIIALIAAVDVGLGPLATLVVSDPKKDVREWRRDLCLIVLVQLVGLGWGVHALWAGRPLFYVFAVDRIEMVAAHEISATEWARAARLNPSVLPGPLDRPRWVGLQLPSGGRERLDLLWRELGGSVKAAEIPRYYRPLAEMKVSFLAAQDNAAILLDKQKLGPLRVAALARTGRRAGEIGCLPLYGTSGGWLMMFDRKTLEFVGSERLPL